LSIKHLQAHSYTVSSIKQLFINPQCFFIVLYSLVILPVNFSDLRSLAQEGSFCLVIDTVYFLNFVVYFLDLVMLSLCLILKANYTSQFAYWLLRNLCRDLVVLEPLFASRVALRNPTSHSSERTFSIKALVCYPSEGLNICVSSHITQLHGPI
jgi:hypothetical protein